jgi:hypothetical protein
MIGWMHGVSTLPLAWMVPAILMGSCALSWVMVSRMRRWLPHPMFKENNEFVGFTYAIFGLIYGVLLAFTIITAWERFSKTDQMVMLSLQYPFSGDVSISPNAMQTLLDSFQERVNGRN